MYYEDLFKSDMEPVRLIVTNLNDSISDKIFYDYFSRWGQIRSFKIMRDIKTNLCRGFGYVTYTNNTSAIRCFHDNPHSIGSNKVNVSTFRMSKTNIDEVIDKMDSTCIMLSYPLSYKKLKEEALKEYFSKYPSFKCIVEGGYGCSFVYFNDPRDVNFIISQVIKVMIEEDTVLVCETSPIEMESNEVTNRFSMLINMWRHQAHCINRRLSSACVVPIDELISNENILQKYKSDEYVSQKLIPRSSVYSEEVYQFSKFISPMACLFETINMNESLKNSHVEIPYQIRVNLVDGDSNENGINKYKLQIVTTKDVPLSKCEWIKSHAFPRLEKWFKNLSMENENFSNESLINKESYAIKYRDIKENIGKEIIKEWTEKTDPLKYVYEDCGISAYLCELWKDFIKVPQFFVDIGCGNGLLSYILTKEGYKGIGIDLRERKIWHKFKNDGCTLIEKTLIPSSNDVSNIGIPRECDFLIGNHSDELTPWIPIIAARLKCNFFLLPCCPFDFYGKFIHVPNEFVKRNDKLFGAQGTSIYNNYLSYLKCLCEKLGYSVKVDRLRIPSTKRIALICTIPKEGLRNSLECLIENILQTAKNNKNNTFIPRNKIEVVRNCSQIDVTVRNNITERIFNKLLNINKDSLYCSKWHTGGSLSILEVFKMLKDDEKILMKKQNGGFQTFLKNQYQIFKIHSGKVFIKNWAQEIKHVKIKHERIHKSECWFYRYHPDGCPLPSERCLFLH